MTLTDLATPGRHPLTGDAAERFAEVVARLDGQVTADGTHATADCPMCGHSAISVTYDERGVALRCNSREAFEDGCPTVEVLGAVGLRFADLRADTQPPKPDHSLLRDGERGVMLRLDLVEMTGSVRDALVLQQISYWLARATIFRDGRWWTAISHRDLAAQTGLDEQQVRKRAVPRLVELGVIDHADRSFAGRRTPHYALREDTYLRLLGESGRFDQMDPVVSTTRVRSERPVLTESSG